MNDPRDPLRSLPEPGPQALAHSARVGALIRDEIAAAGGSIDFERFMELALYAPGLGYYAAGATKLGAAGDFVTAPEVSALFGAGVARQCAQVFDALGTDAVVLELGAGSGVLAADLLLELERLQRLPVRYLILEVSADLAARQRETIAARAAHLLDRVHWLDTLPAPGLCGVVVANEVADALPVQRFEIGASEPRVHALHVAAVEDGLNWCRRQADAPLLGAVAQIESDVGELPLAYRSEWCPRLGPWLASLADIVEAGALLLFDYGLSRAEYYRADRVDGTLICHYRHRAHSDALRWPGLQDLSAWVDFTALARAGISAGLRLAGYAPQALFLLGCGIEDYLGERMAVADTTQRLKLAREAKLLMLPGEMGERLRALAFTRAIDIELRGFGTRDFSAQL